MKSAPDLEITSTVDEEVWRQFVARLPQGNIFHTPEMFHVFERTAGHRPRVWAAVEGGGRLRALFTPVQLSLYGGLLRPLTTRSIAYGSVLCDADPEGQMALRALLYAYRRVAARGALFTEMRNLSDLSAVQPVLNDCGFRYEEHLNYIIDISGSADKILARMGPRTRKHIRQGLRRGDVEVRQVTTREQVHACYDLIKRTYSAARVPLADRTLFEAAFDVLYPRGMVKFWLACVQGTEVATSVELLCKDTMYGWYGGLDRAYAEYSPGEMLMWHILVWGMQHDYRLYDFGGAGRPDETYRVRDFKAKFGGELVCFGRNTCVHARLLLGVSTWGYRLLRRLPALAPFASRDGKSPAAGTAAPRKEDRQVEPSKQPSAVDRLR